MALQGKNGILEVLCTAQQGCEFGLVCNGTFQRCEILGNEENFGGFPVISSSESSYSGSSKLDKELMDAAKTFKVLGTTGQMVGSDLMSNRAMTMLNDFFKKGGKLWGCYYDGLLFVCNKEPLGIYGVVNYPNASRQRFFDMVKTQKIEWDVSKSAKLVKEPIIETIQYNIDKFSINNNYEYSGIVVKSLKEARAIPDFIRLSDSMVEELGSPKFYLDESVRFGVDKGGRDRTAIAIMGRDGTYTTEAESDKTLTPELYNKLMEGMARGGLAGKKLKNKIRNYEMYASMSSPLDESGSGYLCSYETELKAAERLENNLFTLEQAEQILNRKKKERKTKQAIVVREAVKDRQLLY